MTTVDDGDRQKVYAFVAALITKGIKVLALDFDLTLISIHSGGVWREAADKLAEHVRPCMADLIEIAVNRGLNVCVVTYHRQSWLIRDMLKIVVPKKAAAKVVVQGNSVDLMQRQGVDDFMGKEAHLITVLNELYTKRHMVVKSDEVILLDDDEKNVHTAITFNHWAVLVPEDVTHDSFESFTRMLLVT